MERVLADPERLARNRSLTDLLTADLSLITAEDEARIVALYAPHVSEFSEMRSAAIASEQYEPSVKFGRRIEQSGLTVIVFNELTGACTWLGLDATEVRPMIEDLRGELGHEMTG